MYVWTRDIRSISPLDWKRKNYAHTLRNSGFRMKVEGFQLGGTHLNKPVYILVIVKVLCEQDLFA